MLTIDRRSTVRMPLQLDFDLYNCGTYLGRRTTRDIHIDSAFIEGCPDELLLNDIVELQVVLDDGGRRTVYIRGMVVRKSSAGVAVLFGYGEVEFRWLLSALYKNIDHDHRFEVMRVNAPDR